LVLRIIRKLQKFLPKGAPFLIKSHPKKHEVAFFVPDRGAQLKGHLTYLRTFYSADRRIHRIPFCIYLGSSLWLFFSYHCFSVLIVILCTFSFVKGTYRDNVDNRIWYGFCVYSQFDRRKLQKCRSQPKDMSDEYYISCLSGVTFTTCQDKV